MLLPRAPDGTFIRDSGYTERGALKVRLGLGQTIVMYGGIIPHALLPVAGGQGRIGSVLCFRAI